MYSNSTATHMEICRVPRLRLHQFNSLAKVNGGLSKVLEATRIESNIDHPYYNIYQ